MKNNPSRFYAACILWFLAAVLPGLSPAATSAEPEAKTPPALADYIRPLIGTQGEGNTYPGPTTPFGMIQLGPDTNGQKVSGYDYGDPLIVGFSMTHLSGTGWSGPGRFPLHADGGTRNSFPATATSPGPATRRPFRTTRRPPRRDTTRSSSEYDAMDRTDRRHRARVCSA